MAASPSHGASASVSRKNASADQMSALADDLLRSSLTSGGIKSKTRSSVGSASLSSAGVAGRGISLTADEMLRGSASNQGGKSPAVTPKVLPPSYRTRDYNPMLDTPGPSVSRADAAKLLKKELQDQMKRASAQSRRHDTTGLFKTACSTDLLFLMDTTGSMQPYIDSAKEQVRSIVADIKQAFLNESEVRIAVVSYKDHGDSPNIEFLDFTTSTEAVLRFLDSLYADGGADCPEDTLGGIQKALHATWKQQTRCIIHITDAPPHGSELHDLREGQDSYYRCGSEPHGLTYKPMIEKLLQLRVNYALLRITSYTDRMSLCFAGVYGHQNAKLHNENAYCAKVAKDSSTLGTAGRGRKAYNSDVRFEELQLGTTYSALGRLVVSSVTSSVTRSVDRLTMALGTRSALGGLRSPSELTGIREDEVGDAPVTGPTLETTDPQWRTPGWLDKKLDLEGFCPAVIVHDGETLDNMIASNEDIKLSTARLSIVARSRPFAKGALRTASYARTACSLINKYVVKSFIESGHDIAHAAEDMQIQALCKAFALEFNGLLSIDSPLDFLVTLCLQDKSHTHSAAKGDCLSLEPFIVGEYVKYNNNGMYVNEELADDSFNQMAQAFSHFTFERSWGHMLVNDLQGVGRTLTDPSIQTKDPERFGLSDTNLHEAGFKFFFVTHECNSYCAQLELKSCKTMFETGDWEFRETWPAAKPTVCCSNKLCRNIIIESSAQQDPKFEGCHWCKSCWPQLKSSSAAWICIEPGPDHVFEVNRFFHESQGELPPRKCPKHADKTPEATSVAGGSLWKKMRRAPSTTTVSGRRW